MTPLEFHFLRPLWLLCFIPLMVLLWQLWRADANGNTWRDVVDAHLLPRLLRDEGGGTRRPPVVLLAIGWLIGTLALAGPVWERLPQPVYQTQRFRIVALDISPSMNATDLSPSRLARARFKVLDLLRKADEGQTALLAYGAEPYVVSPLTFDVDTIAAQVPSLETSLLPVRGAKRTDLALAQAGALLQQAGAPDGEVILVTDDLDHPAAADQTARKLRAKGYSVSVLGIGTAKGAPVPLASGGFLKDQDGAILMPRLNTNTLRALAEAGGGRYVTARADDRDIEALMASAPAQHAPKAAKQNTHADQWREEGPWLLLALLPLAALSFRRGWLSMLLLAVTLVPLPKAYAFGWNDLWLRSDQQASHKLEAGQAEQAATLFQRPDWRAAAQYQAGDYAAALQSLKGQVGADAEYNTGNTLAKMGRLEDAIAAYDRTLTTNPNNADARHNRELVQNLLKQRRKQQQAGQQGKQGKQNSQQKQGEQQSPKTRAGQKGQAHSKEQQTQQERQNAQHQENPQAQQSQEKQKQQESQRNEASQQPQQKQQDKEKLGQSGSQEQKVKPPQSKDTARNGQETQHSPKPGIEDLLGKKQAQTSATKSGSAPPASINPEDQQAMEQMLRRVEDDPAGLLRQRFLLQHLRRNGQLP